MAQSLTSLTAPLTEASYPHVPATPAVCATRKLVYARPPHADVPLWNADEARGKIVAVVCLPAHGPAGGACMELQQRHAQLAGAAAVIYIDLESPSVFRAPVLLARLVLDPDGGRRPGPGPGPDPDPGPGPQSVHSVPPRPTRPPGSASDSENLPAQPSDPAPAGPGLTGLVPAVFTTRHGLPYLQEHALHVIGVAPLGASTISPPGWRLGTVTIPRQESNVGLSKSKADELMADFFRQRQRERTMETSLLREELTQRAAAAAAAAAVAQPGANGPLLAAAHAGVSLDDFIPRPPTLRHVTAAAAAAHMDPPGSSPSLAADTERRGLGKLFGPGEACDSPIFEEGGPAQGLGLRGGGTPGREVLNNLIGSTVASMTGISLGSHLLFRPAAGTAQAAAAGSDSPGPRTRGGAAGQQRKPDLSPHGARGVSEPVEPLAQRLWTVL